MNTPPSIRGFCARHGVLPVPLELPETKDGNPVCQLCKHGTGDVEVRR